MGLVALVEEVTVNRSDLVLSVLNSVLNTVQAVALAYIAARYSRATNNR